jgi:hypothetical protein
MTTPNKYWFTAGACGIAYDSAEAIADFLKEHHQLTVYHESMMAQINQMFMWRDFKGARELFDLLIDVHKLVSDKPFIDRT